MKEDAISTSIDATLAAAGSKATVVGSGTTLVSWLLSSQFGVLIGLILSIAGFLINLYFKARRDRRDQREHEARMSRILGQ
jgi:hypothetical protein